MLLRILLPSHFNTELKDEFLGMVTDGDHEEKNEKLSKFQLDENIEQLFE